MMVTRMTMMMNSEGSWTKMTVNSSIASKELKTGFVHSPSRLVLILNHVLKDSGVPVLVMLSDVL